MLQVEILVTGLLGWCPVYWACHAYGAPRQSSTLPKRPEGIEVPCRECERQATFHLTGVVGGKPIERHYCEQHAREVGLLKERIVAPHRRRSKLEEFFSLRGLFSFTMTPYERFLRETWRRRPSLSDDELYDRFYSGSGISRDIPARMRYELKQVLGEDVDSLYPSDNLAFGFEDIDLADILYRLQRVFDVQIPLEVWPSEIDGTFDSIVRYIAKELNQKGR